MAVYCSSPIGRLRGLALSLLATVLQLQYKGSEGMPPKNFRCSETTSESILGRKMSHIATTVA